MFKTNIDNIIIIHSEREYEHMISILYKYVID